MTTIYMKLPSLNEYIDVCRSNKYQAAKYKREIESEIALYIARMPRFEKPVRIHFHWVETDGRRDLDNICFAKKFILDAMVKCGKLKDDGQKYVVGFADTFSRGKRNKIILDIQEVENDN